MSQPSSVRKSPTTAPFITLHTAFSVQAELIQDNQWQVNFNLTLPSFQPHMAGVLSLVKLSATAAFSPPITFISSIGTISNYASLYSQARIPEIPFHDPKIAASAGYAESKWIAERLLEEAGRRGVRSNVLRVGQIAGPVEDGTREGGEWNGREWFPSVSLLLPLHFTLVMN